jgi:hypothetical protein
MARKQAGSLPLLSRSVEVGRHLVIFPQDFSEVRHFRNRVGLVFLTLVCRSYDRTSGFIMGQPQGP